MPFTVVGMVIVMGWISGASALATPDAEKGAGSAPKIKVDQPIHDFGTTWIGPVLKKTFVIKNEGDTPLHITKVNPACGCTVAGNYPTEIKPGESGEFPFSLNSR